MITLCIDVEVFNTGPEMFHQLPERSRRNGPMMRCVLLVELGMHWHRDLVRQTVRRSQSILEDDSGNEATFNSFSVLNNDVTSIDDGLLVRITLIVQPRTASKQRDEGLKTPLKYNSEVYPRL